MNKLFIVPMLALVATIALPQNADALSCIDPEGMTKHIVAEPDYVVVTAVPAKQEDFVKNEADTTDVNMMYPEGYTGQFLSIKESHKGTAPDRQWVYFERNSTWNYLCAGEPPKLNSENVYVINVSSNLFQPQTIVATYPADSAQAKDLIEKITAAQTEEGAEPSVYEVTKQDWMQRLYDELKDMAFIVKIKLAEWEFWKGM